MSYAKNTRFYSRGRKSRSINSGLENLRCRQTAFLAETLITEESFQKRLHFQIYIAIAYRRIFCSRGL